MNGHRLLRRVFQSVDTVFVNIGYAGEPANGVHRLDGALGKNAHSFLMQSRLFHQKIGLLHQFSDLLVVGALQRRGIVQPLPDTVEMLFGGDIRYYRASRIDSCKIG